MPVSPDPLSWLQLWRRPGIGPVYYHRLLQHFGTPQAALAADRQTLAALGLKGKALSAFNQSDDQAAERDYAWLAANPRHHLVTYADADYPEQLRQIPAPPPLLFVNGERASLNRPAIALVGTREPTPQGKEIARSLAQELNQHGLAVVSGLARGIDTAAHEGASTEAGITLAVMGTGPDRIYPAQNRQLAERIAAHGALITELPVGTQPSSGNFPRRNRIISGLSLGTLVIEAGANSGSLITARLAAEQGREVFAVPGSIRNPSSRGCHRLIREGAKLVEQVDDILAELNWLPPPASVSEPAVQPPPQLDLALPATHGAEAESRYRLLQALGNEPADIDVLVSRSGLTADTVSSMLLILELEGAIEALQGGRYQRLAIA